MQTGLTNITSATTTTLVDEDLRTTSIGSIAMTNTHASTAVTVELYVQDRTNTVEVLSTLVDRAESYTSPTDGESGGLDTNVGRFDSLANVEVGNEVVFYDPLNTTAILPQIEDPITVTSLTSTNVCEFSSIVMAPDNAVVKFYQLEKGYIVKTDIPGQTTLVVDNIPTINNKKSTLKIKTTGAGLAVATPLTLNIT
tara:strand:- start:550 stop:1140 length:591 start_codon:yes stop_codon:yes gene_type:complete